MSVVETDERDRGTVLHYAPRHLRHPAEERSIRPILERLSRGDSDAPADVQIDTPVHAPFVPPRRSSGWELIACSTLSAVLSAGLAFLAIGWLGPMRTQPARIESARVEPAKVETPPPAVIAEQEPLAVVAEQETALKPEPRRDQIAPKELLAMWSGVPVEAHADAPVEATNTPPAASLQQPDDVEAATPLPPRAEHRESEPRRHEHARRQSHRHAHASRRVSAGNTQAAAAAAQPTESNPLQSALQSIFKPATDAQQQSQPQNY